MVYGQLRRNAGRNGNVDNHQPDFDHDILRPLGDRKLRQLDLRDHIGDGQPAAGSSDIRVGEPILDLFGIEQHINGDRRVGNNLRLVYGQLRRNGGWNRNIDNRQPDFNYNLLRPLGEQLRQLDLRDDISNSQPAAGSSDLRVGKPNDDLFGSQQHVDGDRRVG